MVGTGRRRHRAAAWVLAAVPAVVGGCRAAGERAGGWAEPPGRGPDSAAFAFRAGEGDALRTAVLRMRGPGPVLLLAGTWHVGAPEYYARLGRVLERADLVLSETVRPPWDTAAGKRVAPPDLSLLWRYQRAVAALTGWRLQAEWERSICDERWRPLDLSWRAQSDALGDAALLGPDQRARVKRLEACVRGEGSPAEIEAAREELRAGMGRGPDAAAPAREAVAGWQRARDEAIFAGLREAVRAGEARRIVLLHGPAHLRAILPRVERELGYAADAVLWIPVAGPAP